jgi:hypothetical protein
MPLLLVIGFVVVALGITYRARAAALSCTGTGAGASTVSGGGFAINNPGNLRYIESNPWQGQTGNHNGFGIYDTLANGTRAMGKQLTKYYTEGKTTLTQMITTYAPATENNTAAYIADVSARTNIPAGQALQWPAAAPGGSVGGDEPDVVAAMILHEQGYNSISDGDLMAYLSS